MNANVMEIGHSRLDDGQHTKTQVNILKVIQRNPSGDYAHKSERDLIVEGLRDRLYQRQTELIVPVPIKARQFAEDAKFDVPTLRLWETDGSQRAKFNIDDSHVQAIEQAGRIAIFDCVVGNSPAPMYARHRIREINPDAEIDLLAIWRRADAFPMPHPSTIGAFATQTFLVEEPLKAVPEGDCFLCPDK